MTHLHLPGLVIEPVDDPTDLRVADYLGLSDAAARRRVEHVGGGESGPETGGGGPGTKGFFVAEGQVVVGHLVRSPYRVRSFLVTDRGLRALEQILAAARPAAPADTGPAGLDLAAGPAGLDAPVYLATQPVMEAITGFRFHRGLLASADRRPLPDPATLATGPHRQWPRRLLLVEGVTDNENLGALFRNAAAFGVDAVLLDPTTCDPLYRRSVRVSAGHVLRMPFARMPDWPVGSIAALRGQGFEIVALTPSGSADDLRDLPPHPRRALLVGTEGNGLSAAALSAADRRVRIAMAPDVDSLNVATAAAIALHHLAGPSAGRSWGSDS